MARSCDEVLFPLFAASTLLTLAGCRGIAPTAPAPLSVEALRCEHLDEPLGIGTVAPRLSWQVRAPAAPRGRGWDAVQVQVASTPERLADGAADRWDSGWVDGAAIVSLVYGGRPLAARDVAVWRVRVRDRDGSASPWSAPARFAVGLLSADDWSGAWIGAPDADGAGRTQAPWLARTVALPAPAARAYLHVASLGYHEAWVDGRKVGDTVLAPSVSDLSERVRAVTYDVTPLFGAGRHELGLWLGPGWSRYPRYGVAAGPLVNAELDVVLADGRRIRVATDADWRVHASAVAAIGGWDFGNYGGERIDAGRATPPATDAAAAVPARVFTPAVAIVPDTAPPNRCTEELRPVAIAEVRPGVYRVDMGRAFTGITEAHLRGAPGATIRLSFAEREDQDATYAQRSELVLGPDGEGTFRHRFQYAAARWLTIEGASAAPAPDDVRGFLVRTDYRDASTFRCDDPLLQQVHDAVAWTFECLSLGGYMVDCAHRERWGYGGDAHATVVTGLTHFDLGAFYGKWLDDWAAIQDERGNLPFTCPTYRGGGGPAWSGIVVMLPWEVYRRTGDAQLLARSWPTIERWLAFLETQTVDGILQFYFDDRYTKDVYSFLGDWVPPGGVQAGGPPDERRMFFNNAYRVWAVRTAARIAAALGRATDAQALQARAAELADAVHRRFFDPERGVYVEARQTYYALPVLAGIGPAAVRDDLFRRLVADVEQRRHIDTGIHGTWFLVELLLQQDRTDLLHLVAAQTDAPGWGHMLAEGATTIWEQWDGVNSRMHSSFLSIGAFFVEGLLGIRPLDDAPGYRRFRLAPAIGVGGLGEAKGELRTAHGAIACGWTVDGERAELTVQVPAGTTAALALPSSAPDEVLEGGAPAAQAPGISGVATRPRGCPWQPSRGEFRCELAAGEYRFTFAR